jgi:hypothetical protein
MRDGDGGIEPDADHAVQDPVRQPHPGQRAVPGHDLRPRVPPGRAHRRSDPLVSARPAIGDLLQRPPRGRHRCHQAEQLPLVRHHPEIGDHPGTVRDRACQVGQHPAPVMDQHPRRGQRGRQPVGQAGLVGQMPQQRQSGMRHDSPAAARTSRPRDHPVMLLT